MPKCLPDAGAMYLPDLSSAPATNSLKPSMTGASCNGTCIRPSIPLDLALSSREGAEWSSTRCVCYLADFAAHAQKEDQDCDGRPISAAKPVQAEIGLNCFPDVSVIHVLHM